MADGRDDVAGAARQRFAPALQRGVPRLGRDPSRQQVAEHVEIFSRRAQAEMANALEAEISKSLGWALAVDRAG